MHQSSNVVVDIGNTKIKTALFEGSTLVEKNTFESLSEVAEHFSFSNCKWIISSVRKNESEIEEILGVHKPLILSSQTALPIQLGYKTPETLGVDRIAAVVGALEFGDSSALVIDAGTCITYEVLHLGVYKGGVISPGLMMRMRAMHDFTQKLPDISSIWKEIELSESGKSTQECLLHGSYMATIHEMNGFIDHFLKEFGQMSVILTGGDTPYFESKLKEPIFADFDLVLRGLNRILNHNR